MNRLGNQFLPGTAFTGNQNRRTRRGYLFHQPKYFLHHFRAANDSAAINLATHGLAQRTPFLFFAAALYPRGDRGGNVFILKWLADAAEGALLPGRDSRIERGVS